MSIGSRFVAAALVAAMLVPPILSTMAQAQCGGRWMGLATAELGPNLMPALVGSWDPDGPGPLEKQILLWGPFTSISGQPVSGLGIYNGEEWTTLGGGVSGTVNAFATLPDGRLVVAGSINSFGGAQISNIAAWDGERWEPVGNGVSGVIRALVVMPDGSLVVGGSFATAGGLPARNLARWNGQTWSPIGGGANAAVTALAAFPDGRLVVGGSFSSVGTVQARSIAIWDGSAWSSLSTGVRQSQGPESPAAVQAIITRPDGSIVVGGGINYAGDVFVRDIALWNGAEWVNINAPPSASFFIGFANLSNGDLLAAARFSTTGFVGRFNGTSWTSYPPETRGGPSSLAMLSGDDFAIAGSFTQNVPPGFGAMGLLRWRSSVPQWEFPGGGIRGDGRTMQTLANGDLFFGGSFSHASGVRTTAGAFLTADGWRGAGPLNLNPITSAALVNGESLYITHENATVAPELARVARWSGTTWESVGGGIPSGLLRSCAAWDPDGDGPLNESLVVSGSFRLTDDGPTYNAARWDGNAWIAMPGTFGDSNWLKLHVLDDGELYVSTQSGTLRFDRGVNAWTSLGFGAAHRDAVMMPNGNLVLGGRIFGGGLPEGGFIVERDGTGTWNVISDGMNDEVHIMEPLPDGRLFAGGRFTQAGSQAANRLAIRSNGTWSGMGNTFLPGWVYDAEVLDNGDLILANAFTQTGGFARYRETRTPAVTLQPAPRVVRVGDEVHFSVQGSGDLLNYRWRRNGVNLESGGRVRGAASATLRIFAVQPDDAGLYECVLINPCGTTTSTGALLRVTPAVGSCAYDFNQDGNVDLLDAQTIAQVALSLREPDAAWLDGDVDSDGETTIADAQVLAMYVVSGVCGL
jgi:trimeric autotransporter adhesin